MYRSGKLFCSAALLCLMALPALSQQSAPPPNSEQQSSEPQAAPAVRDQWQFDTPEQRRLFDRLLQELACPTCLGSSLAESPAPIAEDMRRAIWRQIHQGKSGDDIRAWMVERYGASVTTRPQGWAAAVLLWLVPAALAALALCLLYFRLARKAPPGSDFEAER